MHKRRLALILGLLPVAALTLSACSTSSGRPQVQDLSVSRNSEPSASYQVKSGDTLYGIAWQNRIDFRDLAQMNGITPPYRLQPGQQLRLRSGASLPKADQIASSSGGDAQVTALGGGSAVSAAGDEENPSWLLPAGEQSQGRTTPSPQAPGPVAQGDSGVVAATSGESSAPITPSAPSASNPAGMSGSPSAATNESPEAVAQTPPPPADSDTRSSSSSASMSDNSTRTASGDDVGTEVAGEPSGAPDRSNRTYQPVAEVPWQWPTNGQLIGGFNDDSSITPGIDIAGQKGQPVQAAGPGIVVYAGDGVRGYGNLIILKHNDEFLSAYAHNASLRVQENDVVEAGETIATMGQTDADQVSLHFEVRVNGQPQDPMQYLPPR